MAAPSTPSVVILIYLQIFGIGGSALTLPLQTVTTKCEPLIKRPQKIAPESILNDKICESLPTELHCQDPFARPVGNVGKIANTPDYFPVTQNDVFTSNFCPDKLNNVKKIMSDCNINPLFINKPLGLKLPMVISNSVPSVPLPNLKSEYIPSNSLISQILDGSKRLDINSLAMPSPILPINGLPCNSNPYATGFKSTFAVSSTTTCERKNLNLGQVNPPGPIFETLPSLPCQNVPCRQEILPAPLCNNLALPQACVPSNIASPIPGVTSSCNNILPTNTPICSLDQMGPSPLLLNSQPFLPLNPLLSNQCPEPFIPNASPVDLFNNKLTSLISTPMLPQLTCSPDLLNQNNKPDCLISGPQISQCDLTCPLPVPNQMHFAPGLVQCNNCMSPLCNCQIQKPLCPDLPSSSIISTIQDKMNPNAVSPQLGIAPCPTNVSLEPNALTCDNLSPNISPLSVKPNSPINKYFSSVRAATAKLNEFVTSFSNKLASKKIPSLQSFGSLSQMQSCQNNYVPLDVVESKPLVPCSMTIPPSPPPSSLMQSAIAYEEPIPCKMATVTPAKCLDRPNSLVPKLVPVTFQAPIVPKTIVSTFNYPITPVIPCTFQDSLTTLSYNDLPYSNMPTKLPLNPFANVAPCCDLPEIPKMPYVMPPMPSFKPNFLPSALKRPIASQIITIDDNVTNMCIPDLLSVLPISCPKKPFPFLSSISINCTPDSVPCEPSTLSSCLNECVDSSVLPTDFLPPEPSLDESQLELCCKNLENMIALLESSMYFNCDDCDFDFIPDYTSSSI